MVGGSYTKTGDAEPPPVLPPQTVEATPATFAAKLAAANAGDTLELTDGIYAGTWQVRMQNLTIRNKTGTRPIIDGGLVLWADGITLQGLEICNTVWKDRTNATGIPFGVEIVAPAKNCKVIDCLIHDTNTAIIGAEGLTATGNAFWNIGTNAWEHAIYINNDTTPATIRDNIFMPSYGYGLHAYSGAGGKADNITFEHNVLIACPNIQYAMGVVSRGVAIRDNEGFRAYVRAGQASQNNEDVSITGNYLVYGQPGTVLDVQRWNTPTVTGNTLIGGDKDTLIKFVPATNAPMIWDGNTYIRLNPDATAFVNDDGTLRDFADWQKTHAERGADKASTEDTKLPTVNRIVIRQIDTDRAWIVAYNWEGLKDIVLDLSGLGLTKGTAYILRQVQDPKADTVTFTYDGSAVVVSTSGHTVAVPTAAGAAIVASTFPQFGCWLLEKA